MFIYTKKNKKNSYQYTEVMYYVQEPILPLLVTITFSRQENDKYITLRARQCVCLG